MKQLEGRRVYLDANVFIYFLDRDVRFAACVVPVLEAAYAGRLSAITGDLAVAEVMVGLYRTGDPVAVARTREFFATRNLLEIRQHGPAEFDDAARLRAVTGISLADALHVATARRARCDVLLTNDARIPAFEDLAVVRLTDLRSGQE